MSETEDVRERQRTGERRRDRGGERKTERERDGERERKREINVKGKQIVREARRPDDRQT